MNPSTNLLSVFSSFSPPPPPPPPPSPSSSTTAPCFLDEVEKIIGYTFKNKKLLEAALTDESFPGFDSHTVKEVVMSIGHHSLWRVIMGVRTYSDNIHNNDTFLKILFLMAVNINTEKLARVAIRLNLHTYFRHHSPSLLLEIKRFVDAIAEEDDPITICYRGKVKAPKVLADIVTAVVGAISLDLGSEDKKLSLIIEEIFKPTLFTMEDLEKQPEPVTRLIENFQAKGRQLHQVYFKECKNGNEYIASVYVGDLFVTSASAEQSETARLKAVEACFQEETNSDPANTKITLFDGGREIEDAKKALDEICKTKKWYAPNYRINVSPITKITYSCHVMITTEAGEFEMTGEEDKFSKEEAEDSAASSMIRFLRLKSFGIFNLMQEIVEHL